MPTFGVSVAVIHNGRVLLTQRRDFPIWVLPGGAVDDGESLAQAAIRETREETGLEVELTRLVGVYSRPHWRNGGDHSTLFAAQPIGGNLQTVTDETLDARYFDPDELPDALGWWHHERVLDALGNGVGIVRLQNVVWPFGEVTDTEEICKLVEQTAVSIAELFEKLCGQHWQEKGTLEVQS
jgi:8-oxo-dGTP diphosphatase